MNGGSVLNKLLIGSVAAAVIAIGGSLIHPFGTAAPTGGDATVLRDAQIDPATLALFERACQNCHSERTQWPWYSHVAPMSWLIARDAQQARQHMNLSRWQEYSSDERLGLLSEIGSVVRNREMPKQRYLLLHPEARLTDKERLQIYEWTRTERTRLRTNSRTPNALSTAPAED
jgi:heme-binding protein